jgi:hypothetical protein
MLLLWNDHIAVKIVQQPALLVVQMLTLEIASTDLLLPCCPSLLPICVLLSRCLSWM